MKILVLSNLSSYTYNFRLEIIEKYISLGHRVTIACHNDDDKKTKAFKAMGCSFFEVPFNGKGTSIREELSLIGTYRKIIGSVSPDLVLSFTIKMNLYGGLVSSMYRIDYVPMITGLGELEKKGKLRGLLLFLHRRVMPNAKCVIFQNEDNKAFFEEHGIRVKKAVVVPGSGVNTSRFIPLPPPKDSPLVFSFIGRLTYAKGIENFFDAAEALASDEMKFHAAGPVDEMYRERVDALRRENKLTYEGILSDVRPLLEKTSCLVLPTFHPEGISNVILECGAMGRPVICTNRTGCREVVEDGVNGLFCNAKDSKNLIDTIRRFSLLGEEKRKEMGKAARSIVEERFDRKKVVNAYMELLEK